MLEPGRMNLLTVHAIDDQGAWLQANKERALLPKPEVTGDMLSLIHISEPTRPAPLSRMPSSA